MIDDRFFHLAVKFFIIILIIAGSTLGMSQQIERIWTDDQGRNTKALLLRVENDNAILQLPSGKESTFPITKLSKDDQLWIKNFSQQKSTTENKDDKKLNFDAPCSNIAGLPSVQLQKRE